MDIQMANEQNNLPKNYLNEKIDESYSQIEFMSETIESFKDFYAPKKNKQSFWLGNAVQKAINIILPSLQNSNIQLDFNVIKDYEVVAYENEYSQIVLNFLSNAKEIIHERNIVNPYIMIELDVKNNRSNLSVKDNGGGIKEEVISKIFDPYFSTKSKSSGIGLYMSKAIVESHFNGTIHAFNTSKGACFEVNV
jgi:signal transduction histidine kinase